MTTRFRARSGAVVATAMLAVAACSGSADTDTEALPARSDAPAGAEPTEPATAADSSASPPNDAAADAESTDGNAPVTSTERRHLLTVESKSSNLDSIWDDEIYQPFMQANPDITIENSPIQGAGYDDEMLARLTAGTAGDLIGCRAFLQPATLFENGYLVDLAGEPFLDAFDDGALAGWVVNDGPSVSCVPISSVSQAFYYNADALAELGLTVPATMDELFALLQAVTDDGRYVPMVMGTKSASRPLNALFYTIGPTYWGGNEGRQAMIDGDLRFDDPEFIDLFTAIDELAPFLPEAAEFMSNVEARELFLAGEAVIYPGGSWEIAALESSVINIEAFAPPPLTAGGTCIVTQHHDAGIGVNPAGDVEGATRFIEWVSTDDFAERYTTWFPGRYSLQKNAPAPAATDHLAAQFFEIRQQCAAATRLDSDFLDQAPGTRLVTIRDAIQSIMHQTSEPIEMANLLQQDLDTWHSPGGS